MINVLVFPCGSEIGLEVHNALKYDKHLNLYGLSSVSSHGRMVYKNYIEGISFITSETFLDELNRIIDEFAIDVLIPAYDDVILYLSERRDQVHCKIATSGRDTCDLCRSKLKTYQLFQDNTFIPKVYSLNSITEEVLPLFGKPDIGQGSQGVMTINTMQDVEKLRPIAEQYVISELLPGKEYTIDCFTNLQGELIAASMRERKRIRTGISVNSVTLPLPEEVLQIAQAINEKVSFNGVWFFQVKLDSKGHYKLLEMAPRVAGSMSTSRIRGFNYILNTVYQLMDYEVRAIPHLLDTAEVDRAFSNKYILNIDYEYVYLDFDDTITYKDTVNTEMIAFIYQCLNKGKKIILLTRHAKEIDDSLKKYHIDRTLFEDIIHIKDDTLKSNYITHKDSIFIDDSFRERYDVSLKCEIPVFDVDCISALIDWRY
ncbi:MAG: ATP-grasp domain-containing protein [Eubacterium sp.]